MSSSWKKSIKFRWPTSICTQILFLPSNKDHLSGKRILQIYQLLVFSNFRIQTAYFSIGFFGCTCVSRLSPISRVHMSLYARWPVAYVSNWLSRWWSENAKKVLHIKKMYEMSLMKKSTNFILRTCYTELLYFFILNLHST